MPPCPSPAALSKRHSTINASQSQTHRSTALTADSQDQKAHIRHKRRCRHGSLRAHFANQEVRQMTSPQRFSKLASTGKWRGTAASGMLLAGTGPQCGSPTQVDHSRRASMRRPAAASAAPTSDEPAGLEVGLELALALGLGRAPTCCTAPVCDGNWACPCMRVNSVTPLPLAQRRAMLSAIDPRGLPQPEQKATCSVARQHQRSSMSQLWR